MTRLLQIPHGTHALEDTPEKGLGQPSILCRAAHPPWAPGEGHMEDKCLMSHLGYGLETRTSQENAIVPRREVTVLFGNCSQHSGLLASSHCCVLTISFIKENTLTLSSGAREAVMPVAW